MTTSLFRVAVLLICILCLFAVPLLAEDLPTIQPTAAEPAAVDLSAMTKLSEMTTLGVRATAYISALKKASSGGSTHRVAVIFTNEKTGVPVQKAQVGIKHRKLFGDTSEPVWMQASAGQSQIFISDLVFKEHGTYLLIVGSKLEDDKKRQFTFEFLFR